MESKGFNRARTHLITLDSETDFDGWRKAARTLALNGIKPADVTWTVHGNEPELFEADPHTSLEEVTRHLQRARKIRRAGEDRDPAPQPRTLRPALSPVVAAAKPITICLKSLSDPDVAEISAMAKAVRRDEHKMHAFVRFREVGRESKAHYVAWFEPEHHIVELAAPFFARRFADMPWSILTPDVCAHWDGHAVSITPGVAKSEAPTEDRLEEVWRSYYASIFNPARLKVKAMQNEMPKKYWRNLPEASLIKPLIADAERTASAMIANAPTEPHKAQKRAEPDMPRKAVSSSDSIAALRAEAEDCRACPLWKDATQTVFGEGPQNAHIMLVGEQPGDKEDLAGKPFVGPAGQMLDRALEEAGIDRTKVYVTNAVKHFKFVPRGKIRLHQKPNTPEIRACRQWYERELASIKPDLVVAMGATVSAKRVRQDHAVQQDPRPPDRYRRWNPRAGDGASILSAAAAGRRRQSARI